MAWSTSNPTSSFLVSNAASGFNPNVSNMPPFHVENHESHPSLGYLVLLVFEAVMEVICVALPGYFLGVLGLFDAEKQKFLANMNTWVFTPCLVFTKLGQQLDTDELHELAVIPIIFIIQTLVSYLSSIAISRAFRLKKRPANFVTAMAVFGNSNSLPISLVISLSDTLKGLKWDKLEGDTADKVASRGIMYLMIFQQLGQLLRWTWGFNILLAPKDQYEEYQNEVAEEGRYRDDPSHEALIPGLDGNTPEQDGHRSSDTSSESDAYEPAGRTPVAGTARASPAESDDEISEPRKRLPKNPANGINGTNDHFATPTGGPDDIMSFPRMREAEEPETPKGIKGYFVRAQRSITMARDSAKQRTKALSERVYQSLPGPVQKGMDKVYKFIWEFMNPPLWAMIIAIFIASVPGLQEKVFVEENFLSNSVTSALKQNAGVAVPLILVVLGGNLARNTQSNETRDTEEKEIGTRLLIASLLCRMVLPLIIMAPVLALIAKFVPVSILDDPIFVIVCFLLTGAPSALQLAQICQINEVYETVMSKILFQSYVVWILPSTLILVMLALETLEWAQAV